MSAEYQLPKQAIPIYAATQNVCLVKCGIEKTRVVIPWKLTSVMFYMVDRMLLIHFKRDEAVFANYVFANSRIHLSRGSLKMVYFARDQVDYGLMAVEIEFQDLQQFNIVGVTLKRALDMAKKADFQFTYVCPVPEYIDLPPILADLVNNGPTTLFIRAAQERKNREDKITKKLREATQALRI